MKQFKKIYIEITNSCNLSCSFCTPNKNTNYLSVDKFEHIVTEIKPFTDYVYLHILGETLLHPQLSTLLDLCDTNDIKVNITTNGTLIKKKELLLLTSTSLREVNFSLHCFQELNEENKNDYLTNIFSFTEKALAKGKIISLRLWNLDNDNNKNLEVEKNRYILNEIEKQYNLDYKIDEVFIKGQGIKIKQNLYLNFEREFVWPDLSNTYKNERGFCYALRTHLAILVDGTVVPCCLDTNGIIDLGNIYQMPLAEILKNDRLKKIYNGFSNKKAIEELCQKCSFKEKFD